LRCSHPLSSSQTPTHNPPHTRPDTTTPAPQPKHPAQHETPKPDKDKDSCYGTTAGPDLQRQHPPGRHDTARRVKRRDRPAHPGACSLRTQQCADPTPPTPRTHRHDGRTPGFNECGTFAMFH
jgi:hypothetical protein